MNFFSNNKIDNNMSIILEFILSVCIFIYGIQLFSKGISNLVNEKAKNLLIKYTNTKFKGIILGTILTIIIQSSGIVTILTLSFVNSNLIDFSNTLGIIMGSNLGTCFTSWLTSFINTNNFLVFLNPTFYTPIFILLGLIFFLKNKIDKSNTLLGLTFFLLGLKMLNNSLTPIMNYSWFKSLLIILNNPFLGILLGIILTSIIGSSAATVAILQTITKTGGITYLNSIPIILGENIGSSITGILGSINTKKDAKMVSIFNLLYNLLGTIIFMLIYFIFYFLKVRFLYLKINSYHIALIHTLFNFLSIIVFYPYTKYLERLTRKMVKKNYLSKKNNF